MLYINIFWNKTVKVWLSILIYRFDKNIEKLKNQNDKEIIDDLEEEMIPKHCKCYIVDFQ